MTKKEVKEMGRSKRNKNFYLCIYQGIIAKKSIPVIAEENATTTQNLNYYISRLKALGIIKKVSYGVWEIKKEVKESELKKEVKKRSKRNLSWGTSESPKKPVTNLHALEIRFPILSGKIEDKSWDKLQKSFNNWLPKYKDLDVFGGLKVKNNNNKSLTIYAKSRDLDSMDLSEIDNLAFKIRWYAGEYFKNKYEVTLDIFNCEVKNINLATEDNKCNGMLRKGEKFELDLKKKCEKIFPADNMDAKAWLDGSPYQFTAETNDKEWKRAYLQMPFNIRYLFNTLPSLEEYNRNLQLHIKVQQEQLKTQKAIQRLLERLDK